MADITEAPIDCAKPPLEEASSAVLDKSTQSLEQKAPSETSDSGATRIQARGLVKVYGHKTVVNGADLEIGTGEVVGLLGPNGAGKTTLVSLLCGRIEPTSGTVSFDGRDISRLPAHRRINLGMAYTFQITSVFANLSVRENVALAARRRVQGAARVAAEVQSALDRVGLGDRLEALAPPADIRPVDRVRIAAGRERRRASGAGAEAPATPWTWGDDQ